MLIECNRPAIVSENLRKLTSQKMATARQDPASVAHDWNADGTAPKKKRNHKRLRFTRPRYPLSYRHLAERLHSVARAGKETGGCRGGQEEKPRIKEG
jgi:hypothetical protein